ncbi:nesprin-1-like isoform X3 [Carcharodon carcharias]|uniref:nesprin-1-like isoform X3 n=1 Tax=Carcharodon carcharias TaxID=13397 RepID=UPI001B7F104B|nr:nesprin-1-like isoform X3 [Carcharodon carcharias]
MRHLQQLIDRAHREIQEKPVSTSNIQQLQAQISRHEDFAQKIKGYQEQIAALNTKCKMLTMKAKHATMLLTVTEVEGLSEGMEELDGEPLPSHTAHPSVVMDSTYYATLSADELQIAAPDAQDMNIAASLQEPFETTLGDATSSKLDDLQRSWETLKNVISEKQRTLYEALERQQKYQDSVQSVSAKMESIEGKLGEALDAGKSHDVQMAAHQALMDEIVTLQDEINELQICFAEELVSDTVDTDTSDQLAMQSTLTVLAERMATIKMKALGKKQLLEERLNEQVEEQRQEQALQLYLSEADELDNWLLITKATLDATLKVPKEQMDMEEQLIDCQNMLVEIEQKVASVSELFMNSENLLIEGKPQTRGQAEHLTEKLRNLKGSLTELQKMLQDRRITIKHGVVQEKEDTEIDSTFHSSPSVQEWLVQARATRYQHQQNSLLRQKELEQQLAEQKNLLRSVASSGEKIMTQQSSMETVGEEQRPQAVETARSETLPQELGFEGEKLFALQQLRIKWQNLQKEISTKQKMFKNTLEQNQEQQQVYSLSSAVSSGMALFKGEAQTLDKSVQTAKSLLTGLGQAIGNVSPQGKDAEEQSLPLEQKLYDAASVTSHWLDGVEDHLFASASFLPEKVEAHLYHDEALAKDIEEVIDEVNEKKDAFFHIVPEPKNQDVIEDALSCLQERLSVLGLTVKQQCEHMKDQLQQLMEYQTELKLLITSLADSKYVVLQKLAEALEHTVTEQLQAILQAEDDLREFETRIGHLKERGEELQPDQAILLDLSKVQDMYEELTMIIGSSRSSLNQSLALRSQYEQALQDLADLTDTGQEKMSLDKRILVTSREDVKSLLEKHKEFFQGLESHKILTETLCKKVSTCIHQKETSSQQELMSKTSALLKKAHKRGVELESIFETWTNLAKDYEALYRQLEGVESNIPGAGLVEESEERLTERITLYQRLKGSLTEHQPQLYQVLEDGKRLLMSISCADLEVQIAQLGEHWLSSTTRVSRELHRLETVLKHWNRYQAEYAELNQWLQSAMERLEFWKLQSVTLPQELDTVRNHLSSFLEFSKEVDTKSSLKSSVLSRGNQLLRLKKVDTAALRSGLAQTDSQWTELLTQIPLVQEKLHQLQMEKLPSRTAINELMNWISLMDQIIEEDDERIKSAVGSQMIEQCLKKYKAFKIDLTCKQLTVDFVNQSVLQISSHDVESKRSDKTDFAERLGIMNRRWQLLQGLITEKIRSLEGSLESWTEYENSVECLKTWFETQEDKMKKWHSISDLASVHTALKDCQELESLIQVKEKEVEKVEQSGLLLIQNKKEEASSDVRETLRELNHSWAHLDRLVVQLKITLQSVLDQWNIYKEASEEINGHLMDARYSLSRFRLLTGSLEAVKIQVDNLQHLQEELERSECSLRKFDSVSNQLLKECHPPVNSLLTTNLNEVNTGWNNLLQDIVEQLHSSKVLLQLWQKYKDYSGQCSVIVQQQEEKSNELMKKAANRDIAEEEVTKWIQDCDVLLEDLGTVRDSLHVLSDLGEELRQQVDSSAAAAIQSDQLFLTQRLSSLEQALSRQRNVLQAGVQDYEAFSRRLEALEKWIVEADEVLKLQDPNRSSDLTLIQDRMEELKVQMLRFSSTVPDLDRLNELGYRLPLNDKEIKRMQTLNRHWSSISAQTTERFSKLQAFLLQHQTFLEKCETWMEFLVQTEQKLAVEISGNYQNLLEQQRAHELFQAEMFSRQQILHSIISDGQHLLEQGQVDDRDEFNSKLAMLSNQWQGVIRRAQQRRGIIDSQIRQWQRYREMAEKLRKWLLDVSQQLERRWSSAAPIALQQARALLDEVQLKEKVLQRQQGSYILTVEAGKQLLLSADSGAEAALQAELTDVQEQWRAANIHLEEQRKQLNILLKDWEQCEKGIADSLAKLRSFKKKLSQPLPDHHDELHTEQIRCMELESSFEGWTDDLAHLSFLKETLSSCIRADDISLLQERIELLHRQWDELCYQVSLRRQLVTEKLNKWALFNEKNKELCEWLTLMESKVSQNGDISIEEMIEKLKKDYQEEITAARENKMQLQQMGQRLIRASHESKASEIEYKLGKVDDRWQHLLDLIGARVKKLKETLVAVQQLDKNMSSLRSWLAQIETELSRPIVYDSCNSHEIQQKLAEQQELQRDIEKHSTGVASVLNLCEVLLHDCDACATETECDSIQQATRNLDRRWRNICAMSMERRLKIEETWRLWQKFLDDYSRFEDWLETSERTAAVPNSSEVLYTVAKEELKKFEAFQRQVHESLTQLELINKQYRRLARENRTDSGSKLKDMVHEGNQRWDNLQRRVTAILRRLKHFIGQREEFETTRENILVWLTEMDLQLTNIEHFSECDVQAKIKQLKAFQQEISLNMSRINRLFVDGEQLIEKNEPMDAAIIEEELEELRRYYQEVFGRVDRYYKKLMQLPLTDDELEVSDREVEMDDNIELSSMQWLDRAPDSAATPPLSLSRGTGLQQPKDTRSGRDTPASVDSIPLEWDHDYDLSRNLESAVSRALEGAEEDAGDEDSDFYLKGAAEITDVVIPESPEAYLKLTESTLRSTAGEPGHLETQIRQLDKALDSSRYHLQQTENAIRSKTPTGPELDSSYWGYMKLLSECRGSIETVKRVGHKLKEEEDKLSGLINLTSTETQTSGVIERWELIQAQALNKELRMKQNLQQWQQFNSDLDSIWEWLSETEEELEHLSRLDISTDIQTIELRIKKLKELQKAVDNRKAIILSINLCSAEFTQSDTSDALELRERLSQMNKRWDRVGSLLEDWRSTLQDALMQCHDFHEMSHGLLLWLENIDRRRNEILPIDPNLDSDTLQDHHKTLMQIRRELLESQLKVASLQDMSSQLLVNVEGRDCLEAKEKVHVIGNRLKLLLKEVTQDLKELERLLDNCGSQVDLVSWSSADDLDSSGSLSPVSSGSLPVRARLPRGKFSLSQPGASVSSPHSRPLKGSQRDSSRSKEQGAQKSPSFFLRVIRAALPLQLLLLLLIALACLVPMTEEDYSCATSNNFARSFHPMLRYTNGPPPI